MMYVKEYRRWRPVKQSRRPLLDSSTTLVTFDMHYVPESEDVMFVFVLSLFVLKIRLGTHLVQHPIFNALYLLAYNDLHPVSTNMVLYEEETDCNLIGVLENIQSLSIILQRYKMRKKDLKNKFIPLLYISSTCEAFTALSQRSTAQGAWTDNCSLCAEGSCKNQRDLSALYKRHQQGLSNTGIDPLKNNKHDLAPNNMGFQHLLIAVTVQLH